jgi:hypothetical protein
MLPHSDTLVFSKYISEPFFRFVFYAFPVGVVAAACFSRFLSHRPTAYLGLWSVAALVCTMRTRDSCVFKVVASSSRFSCITGCTCAEPLPLKHLTLIYFDVQVHLPFDLHVQWDAQQTCAHPSTDYPNTSCLWALA